MTIEQKPELNRFVDPSIPLTWAWRWRQIKMTLPIWLFSWACLLEMGLFKAWLRDGLTLGFIVTLLAFCLCIFGFVLGMAEIQIRIRHRSKRSIQFKDNKIVVKPANNQVVRWKNVQRFQFEPLAEAPGLTKLTLHLHGRQKNIISRRAFWAAVLESPSQVQELVRYLQTKQTEVPASYQIDVLEHPAAPINSISFPLLGISLYMCGFFLLLHGGPMLLASLNKSHGNSSDNSKFTVQESAKLGNFVREHFASREEFIGVFMTLGISLTVCGVAMLILGWWMMNRKIPVPMTSKSA